MKEKYLVSIDVDKTLVNDQGNIRESSVYAIDCLLSKGNFVAINSGRSFYRSLYPLRDHPFIADQFYVSGFNGAF
ncbi:Cof-type HAD-IIB family hydrolase, partial [Candidatus Poribacteria bacterium]|nr:Cof-type HAD-IIB family hydrolase [Candidatus Poribacteria bacterium]